MEGISTSLHNILTSVLGQLFKTEEHVWSAPVDKGVIMMNFASPQQVRFSFDGPDNIASRISELNFESSQDGQYKFFNNKWVYVTTSEFVLAMKDRLKEILGYTGLGITDDASKNKENTKETAGGPIAFHCFDCGGGLTESGMGFYHCRACDHTFLPFKIGNSQCMQLITK